MKYILLIASVLIFSWNSYGQIEKSANLVINPGFEQMDSYGKLPSGWKLVFPRQEIAPPFTSGTEMVHAGKRSACLSSAGNRGTFGFITTKINVNVSGKKDFKLQNTVGDTAFLSDDSYLISGYFTTSGISFPERNIRMKISWLDEKGDEIFTEFVSQINKEGAWYHISELKRAPFNSSAMSINLILQWTESGSVYWDDISVSKAPSVNNLTIRAASAASWPKYPSTTEKNLQFYSDLINGAGKREADIVCLGEGITMVSTGKTFADVAETVPGPSTKILGEAAKKAHAYVIAGLYERDGSLIYNTAVLIDRDGRVAGKYRKTHLPQTEVEGGLTPGDDYPVFKTDLGMIGIEICYDNFFPEVTGNLARNGARMIFCPIWGDIRGMNTEWSTAARARAIDNSVWFISSMYEPWGSMIIDPNGRILAESEKSGGFIISPINLNMRTLEKWLSVRNYGEWQNLFRQERRPETYK